MLQKMSPIHFATPGKGGSVLARASGFLVEIDPSRLIFRYLANYKWEEVEEECSVGAQ
jgi:hypothetical protein